MPVLAPQSPQITTIALFACVVVIETDGWFSFVPLLLLLAPIPLEPEKRTALAP